MSAGWRSYVPNGIEHCDGIAASVCVFCRTQPVAHVIAGERIQKYAAISPAPSSPCSVANSSASDYTSLITPALSCKHMFDVEM